MGRPTHTSKRPQEIIQRAFRIQGAPLKVLKVPEPDLSIPLQVLAWGRDEPIVVRVTGSGRSGLRIIVRRGRLTGLIIVVGVSGVLASDRRREHQAKDTHGDHGPDHMSVHGAHLL
jgi:hypothetical protein